METLAVDFNAVNQSKQKYLEQFNFCVLVQNMKQDRIRPNFQQAPLQQVTIEAEMVRGENQDDETKVTFLNLFLLLFVKLNLQAWG